MRLTEAEIQERRKNIILTALHLFCERGIEDVTLNEISLNARVGEATVYRYFENKVSLVLETLEKLWRLFVEYAGRRTRNLDDYWSLTGLEQVKVWLHSYWAFFLNNSEYILFCYEAVLYLSRHKVKLDRFRKDILLYDLQGSCIAALEKGKVDGTISSTRSSIDLFSIIWCSVQGYVEKRAVYNVFLDECETWGTHYGIMEQSVLSILESGQ